MKQTEKTILIIDDDIDFQLMMKMTLSDKGFKVRSLFDGECKAALSQARLCDLVLLDIDLPGSNGVEVGRYLKADPQTTMVPIILISGHTDAKKELAESQADVFIRKPFPLTAMISKITQLIKKRAYT